MNHKPLPNRKVRSAMDWLLLYLKQPRYSEEVFMEATKEGYTKGTVYRAARNLEVKKSPIVKHNGAGAQIWVWKLETPPIWVTCPYCERKYTYFPKHLHEEVRFSDIATRTDIRESK